MVWKFQNDFLNWSNGTPQTGHQEAKILTKYRQFNLILNYNIIKNAVWGFSWLNLNISDYNFFTLINVNVCLIKQIN
jgi:hypothetical protein